MSRSRLFTLFSALYLAQGLPYGFFTQALPVLLRKAQISLPAIGLAHLLAAPWALKFLWAPAVDRWQIKSVGLRRSWILPMQMLSIVAFAWLAHLEPAKNLGLVLAAFLITNWIAAAQDIATDGLAVDLMSPADRGWTNGIKIAGYRVGMVVGGGVLLWIDDVTSWSTSMWAMAAVAAACTIPVWRFREPPHTHAPPRVSWSGIGREIVHFALKPGARAWIAILVLFKIGHYLATGMLRPWLVDSGYSLATIAGLLSTFGFGAGFLGALVGGAAAARWPRRRLLVIFGVLEWFSVTSYLWPVWTQPAVYKVAIATMLDHFTSGLATAVLFTLMMDASSKDRAAADYTLQSCIVVTATSLAAASSGLTAEHFGYLTHFLIASAATAVSLTIAAILLYRPSVVRLLNSNNA